MLTLQADLDDASVEVELIHDIYLDNVTTAAVVAKNFDRSRRLKLRYHADMVGSKPDSRKPHDFTNQKAAYTASSLLQANRCPRGKEDPATCGCGAERIQAEGSAVVINRTVQRLFHQDASPDLPGNPPPPNYVKFTPASNSDGITFSLPNPEAGSIPENVWYNLKIGMLQGDNYGEFKLKLGNPGDIEQEFQPGKEIQEYKPLAHPPVIFDQNEKIFAGARHSIADRLTRHQVLWHILGTPATVTITLIPTTGTKPITLDYFEFYRAADHN